MTRIYNTPCYDTRCRQTTTGCLGHDTAEPARGWVCPKCNRVYAPVVTACAACNGTLFTGCAACRAVNESGGTKAFFGHTCSGNR